MKRRKTDIFVEEPLLEVVVEKEVVAEVVVEAKLAPGIPSRPSPLGLQPNGDETAYLAIF